MRAACSGLRLVTRLITGLMLPLGSMAGASIGGPLPVRAAGEAPSCVLASPSGAVSHVIYVQFDNTHFTRDNPKVPSDLEQMPNLLNFIKDNGVLLSNHHTPLISHTATDILTSLTAHANEAFADIVGIGVDCVLLQPLCLTSDNAKDDKLRAESGLCTGFKAL